MVVIYLLRASFKKVNHIEINNLALFKKNNVI